ncbi:hypothetical protein ACK3SF_04415 [Candidatus Nanosalina sp. VS9-1]|uniref:hypothetical protein n=1 Tax=Candidatus Nanosalina sp. VS9-1 TaxID=3388566 RepID=UPI0039DF4CA6
MGSRDVVNYAEDKNVEEAFELGEESRIDEAFEYLAGDDVEYLASEGWMFGGDTLQVVRGAETPDGDYLFQISQRTVTDKGNSGDSLFLYDPEARELYDWSQDMFTDSSDRYSDRKWHADGIPETNVPRILGLEEVEGRRSSTPYDIVEGLDTWRDMERAFDAVEAERMEQADRLRERDFAGFVRGSVTEALDLEERYPENADEMSRQAQLLIELKYQADENFEFGEFPVSEKE